MSSRFHESEIAKITYHDSGEIQVFTDRTDFLRTLADCLDTLGPNFNMFRAEVRPDDLDLRYEVDCMYYNEFGEDPPEKQEWLSELKAREQERTRQIEAEKKPLDIKVMLENGVVTAVLAGSSAPINIEIVSCDDDYEDLDALQAYRDYLYANEALSLCEHVTADFTRPGATIPNYESYYRGLILYGLPDTPETRKFGAEICRLYEDNASTDLVQAKLSVLRAGAGEGSKPSLTELLSGTNSKNSNPDPKAKESHSKAWYQMRDLT